MIAVQYQAIYNNNYENYILNDLKITTYMCSQCRQKLETIQLTSSACHALAPGDYTPSSQSSSQHCPSRTGYQIWTVTRTTNVVL